MRPNITFDLSEIKYEIERFLLGGEFDLFEDQLLISSTAPEHVAAEVSFCKLILSCWGDGWARSWRILSCDLAPERLTLECSKQMGLKRCALIFNRGPDVREATHGRKDFVRKLTAMIEANLTGFRVEKAVAARNDPRHLSGVHARLVIRSIGDGDRRFAGIGVSETELQQNIDTALGAGLVWLEELRRRSGRIAGLMIFAPRCDTNAMRLTAISPSIDIRLFRIDETKGLIDSVSPFDQGDLNDRFRKAARRA